MVKVLTAEDNAVNRELIRELLELRGYSVLEACDGQEALQMVEQTQPEMLLLDIGMPVMDGFAVIRRIRENPRLATLPVVAVTAYAMRGDKERILSSGFDGYSSKPVNPSSLARDLQRVLTKSSQAANPGQAHEDQPEKKAKAVGGTGSATYLDQSLRFDLGFHLLHVCYKLSNRLLTLRAYIRELDALALLICPHDNPSSVNGRGGDWQLE